MGQHCYSRLLRSDSFDGIKFLHVTDPINDGVYLPREVLPVLQYSLTTPQLNLPSRIEKVGARKNDVSVVHVEMSGETHQSDQRDSSKRRLRALSR